MATDHIQLFDLRLCERILQGDETKFVSTVPGSACVSSGEGPEELLVAASKAELILETCLLGVAIPLDYWGCYVEVLMGDTAGATSSTTLLSEPEETFLLLLPEHVDRMLEGLHKHRQELVVMTETTLGELARIRDLCAHDTGLRAAYLFD